MLRSFYISQGLPLSVSGPVFLHTSFKIFDQEVKGLVGDNNERRGRMPSRGMEWGVKIHRGILRACSMFCSRLCRKHKDEKNMISLPIRSLQTLGEIRQSK